MRHGTQANPAACLHVGLKGPAWREAHRDRAEARFRVRQRRCAIIDVLARRIRVSGEQMHDIYMEHGTGAIMALVRNCLQKADASGGKLSATAIGLKGTTDDA